MRITPCSECSLRKLECFSKATSDEISFIQSYKKTEIKLSAGKTLVHQGSRNVELYTLKSGWAFRYSLLENGKRQILNFILPGDFIGLQAELDKELNYGIESLTECVFCVFPQDRIMDVYSQYPTLGYDLTWLAAHGELIVDENLISVGGRNALQRIAMLLVSLYKRASSIGEVVDESFNFPITQQHIADSMGLSLVHTNKTMAKLKLYGVQEITNNRIKIRSLDKIARLAEYYSLPLRNRPLL
ncbi:MAG: Crp/Fnr family transcriptional regulator [Methylotenera sp.]|uniref:Crp/Fnr family transcriptional regulator n=1 Tax=Methylotenera sp. TaxID=2051956 RepID=UPI002487C534|nr:Crp/Fnr family transcriptional regulator [Methylotenera sp.]MDI1310087.1 Crp/Fnr family transcriptional regulator [Methylotenera sp.]